MDKQTQKLMFSSKRQDWATPKYIFDELDKEFNFTLDPCCSERTAKCKRFFTIKEDGLKRSWEGERVFVNPPYGKEIKKWVKKCFEERESAEVIVMLIPARTDTSYFHDFIYGNSEIRFIRGRLKFINLDFSGKEEDRKLSSAPFPSMVVIFKQKGGKKKKRRSSNGIFLRFLNSTGCHSNCSSNSLFSLNSLISSSGSLPSFI